MKTLKKFFMTTFMLFIFASAFAFGMLQDTDITNPNYLVIVLTPFVVLAVTFVFDKLIRNRPDWVTLFLVSVISAGITWSSTALLNTELNWATQFLLGLASTFFHQFYKKLTIKDDSEDSTSEVSSLQKEL